MRLNCDDRKLIGESKRKLKKVQADLYMINEELIKRAHYLSQRFEDYKSREELRVILHKIVQQGKKKI